MSKFYDEISKYYDDIFPTGKYQVDLLREVLGEKRKEVLDIACGNGGYSKVLSDLGHKVTAVDLNESMIEILNKNYENINGKVLNMLDIDKLGEKYNLAYCIGNSLVHLDNDEEILDFLIKSKEILKEDGNLVLQIINYNRILDKKIDRLPAIENEKLKFYRFYEYIEDENKIDFKTILEVDDNKFENSELLYPIRSEKLKELLNKAGYNDVKIYGSFKKDEYDEVESYATVVVAK